MSGFEFLNGFRHPPAHEAPMSALQHGTNAFFPVSAANIADAERALGYRLPPQLQEFYRDIGYGFLQRASNGTVSPFAHNRTVSPSELLALTGGEHDFDPPGEWESGDLPFFYLGDGLYLVMRPFAANPNAVYFPYGRKVADDLVEFYTKLLQDPLFYHNLD